MAGILDHPQAQRLLADATLPLFTRSEQRRNVTILLEGKRSDLQRKTVEPIAIRG